MYHWELPRFRKPEEVPWFGKPDEVSRLGVSEGIVRDTAANCGVLHERERKLEKRKRANEREP